MHQLPTPPEINFCQTPQTTQKDNSDSDYLENTGDSSTDYSDTCEPPCEVPSTWVTTEVRTHPYIEITTTPLLTTTTTATTQTITTTDSPTTTTTENTTTITTESTTTITTESPTTSTTTTTTTTTPSPPPPTTTPSTTTHVVVFTKTETTTTRPHETTTEDSSTSEEITSVETSRSIVHTQPLTHSHLCGSLRCERPVTWSTTTKRLFNRAWRRHRLRRRRYLSKLRKPK
ncbi:salivary glue protein Sgs-3-like [Trichoplusia ni]|uniref:Salivary glue protein Sgs-3-like n=1 Tax=Trichoplusia ni TaxID=7111 RepID=A0A7E5W4T2_TRINI|nr:salivary glue protein Sgs-3-like [Trichoplusia ni]